MDQPVIFELTTIAIERKVDSLINVVIDDASAGGGVGGPLLAGPGISPRPAPGRRWGRRGREGSRSPELGLPGTGTRPRLAARPHGRSEHRRAADRPSAVRCLPARSSSPSCRSLLV